MKRGIGTTSKQMLNAPKASYYIWCNGKLDYPKQLAKHLNRTDLVIVGPNWIRNGRWKGLSEIRIVIDHATLITHEEIDMMRSIIRN